MPEFWGRGLLFLECPALSLPNKVVDYRRGFRSQLRRKKESHARREVDGKFEHLIFEILTKMRS